MPANPYHRSDAAIAVLLLTLAGATPAAAYLDPASGSMLLQVLLGGIAGLALFFKLFWRKVQGWFGGRKKADAAPR
jgi:hypothetical protein